MTSLSDVAPSDASPLPLPEHPDDLWVFGYGSLMWRPGFEYVERIPARLYGVHRALCVYSFRHRGTPEAPGLVLGLDRGGSCQGIAFRVAAARVSETRAYLTTREQVTYVYRDLMHNARLKDGRRVKALAYVSARNHSQYAGGLDRDAVLRFIRQGHGESGACSDYVLNTLAALEDLGIHDHALHWLGAQLAGR